MAALVFERITKAIDLRGGTLRDFREQLEGALRESFGGGSEDLYAVDIMDGIVVYTLVTDEPYEYTQFAVRWSRGADGIFEFGEPTQVEQTVTYRPVAKSSGAFEDLIRS